MKPATDSASFRPRAARHAPRLAALALCALASGCASGSSSWRSPKGLLAGGLWKGADKAAEKPGYDLYAARAAESLPDKPGASRVADRSDPAQAQDGATRAEAAGARPAQARAKPSRSKDASIRVTLGRPEGLPTTADAGGPVLASASTPRPAGAQWKRPDEPSRPSPTLAESRPSRPRPARREAASDEDATAPAANPSRTDAREDKLRTILAESRRRLEKLGTYQVRITRVERVNGQLQPEEEALLSIRRKPQAVRLEWPAGPSKGREVIYSAQLDPRMMYVHMGNSSLPLPRMTIPVDSPLALRNSRHPITEAGFDTILQDLFRHLDPNADAAARGKLVYKELHSPKGLNQPCHLIERVAPEDETWQVYLDPRSLMPVSVVATRTSDGALIERYTYRGLRPNPTELAAADAFDPDRRWGESKGLFSRLARAPNPAPGADSAPAATR